MDFDHFRLPEFYITFKPAVFPAESHPQLAFAVLPPCVLSSAYLKLFNTWSPNNKSHLQQLYCSDWYESNFNFVL